MKKHKIADTKDIYVLSSNNCEDKNCPVCCLLRKAEKEGREPTKEEIEKAMLGY